MAPAEMARELSQDEALELCGALVSALQTVVVMEQLYWQRREANLEARRVDTRNSTYRHATVDLSFPAPGCGAGPWDGLPPGHAAQPVDLQVAGPVLTRLGLPASWDGYGAVFGRAYLGSHLGRGALWRCAQAHPEVEARRHDLALAAALR